MGVILGINAFHAGAAAALVIDGKPVVAIAEERLNRVKHHGGFPAQSIQRCLDYAGAAFSDIDAVAIQPVVEPRGAPRRAGRPADKA